MKYFCLPRDDPKTEMAAISEETHSQTVRTVTYIFCLSFLGHFPNIYITCRTILF